MDKEEFINILNDHRKLIYKVCNSYCQDTGNRQDLEQEIVLQLWRSIKKFDGRVKLSTWIYKVALNTAITFHRNECKQKNKKSGLDASVIALAEHQEDCEDEDKIALLYQFIGQLNEMDKALMLLYLDNTKHKEIADIIGITESNVATKIARIKKKLKEQFINH
ncbi:MAG: sigma-70 family RNA polymerase sigma factor [Marinilabiliaceae bacterium]|nr:sigma-70 family RNA polymerase sigma factor [Marinilabiliaceae bacterium]